MRRQLAAWMLTAALGLAWQAALAATACDASPRAERIAPGAYLVAGRDEPPTAENGGLVVNRVFLVGPRGVVVVDPGPSPAAGRALRCTIRRVTAQPVVAVVLTHPHPENVLAAAAFPETTVYADAAAAEAMARRCERCQRHLASLIGNPDLGTQPPPRPDQPVGARRSVAPGGRALTLIPLGAAHSPGDLAVLDVQSGLLVGGDAANADTLPDLHDGHVQGMREALRRLAAESDVTAVVPGRGRPFPPSRLDWPQRYLAALWQFAEQRVEQPDGFVPPTTLPESLVAFPGDPERHALNLQHALREAEEAWWTRPPAAMPH